LEIAIQGAKHDTVPVAGGGTAQRGYPYRILTVAADANEAAQWLYDAMAEGANWRRFQYNQSTYRNSLTSWGMRIFGVAGLCPYAFRHQMGEELKTSDAVTLLEAAQAMGHHSAATLWRYGNGRRGRHTRRPFVRVYVPEPRPAAPAPGLRA
jgi:integrase